MKNPRQTSLLILHEIYQKGAYTDITLDRILNRSNLSGVDRGLVCELVYGIVRRKRTLDFIIDCLGKKKAERQPPDLRIILHLGLYQLRYLDRIPESAAVNTSVELAKQNGYGKLAGVVNGLLRQYQRLAANGDPLILPENSIERLGISYSFPDWIVKIFLEQFSPEETDRLCAWFNQTPVLDLRINPLKTSIAEVIEAIATVGVSATPIPHLPQALRISGAIGSIQQLPGFDRGWWIVQDSSAQLVTHLLDPQPGELIIDACAAPGGKTTHIAELMGDQGTIWAIDKASSRLRKVQANVERLQLKSIQVLAGDSRNMGQFKRLADRVLLDAPCSGLGTLHKRPDIRWQSSQRLKELTQIQQELLESAASWVKPGGILVYATCTLNPQENQQQIQVFLENHSDWQIQPPKSSSVAAFATEKNWIEVIPHRNHMDGFFMAKLKKGL